MPEPSPLEQFKRHLWRQGVTKRYAGSATWGSADVELAMDRRRNKRAERAARHGVHDNPAAIILDPAGWHRAPSKSRSRQSWPQRTIPHATRVVTYNVNGSADRLSKPLLHYTEGADNRTLTRAEYRELSSWLRRNRPNIT